MGQATTKHLVERGHVVTSQALRGELRNYADVRNKTALSKKSVCRFLVDMHELLLAPMPPDLLLAIELDEGRDHYTIEECVSFFVQSVDSEMLSESLCDHVVPGEVVVQETRTKKVGLFDSPTIEVQSATTMEPLRPDKWCPPAQYFSREWSLILMSRRLSTKDLNNVSLVCRYLRTVMLKYPPQNWRVIQLSSLEKRTAENMSQFAEYERLQGCCRLEVGCLTFANMFKDEDLTRVFANLKHLASLKLFWCHLLRGEGFAMSQGLPGALRLRELRLHRCDVDAAAIVAACPALTSLGVSDCDAPKDAACFAKLRELKRLIWLKSGSPYEVLGCASVTHLWMDPMPLTLSDLLVRMPGLRVCVLGTAPGKPTPPLVDFYTSGALLPQGDYYTMGKADWELLPQE